MAITPLFTNEELDTQIAAAKKALLDVHAGLRVRWRDQEVTLSDAAAIQNTLVFLQSQRVKNAGIVGPQFLPGRVRR